MTKKEFLLAFALVLLLATFAGAQTRFTSVYTSLDKGCKTIKGYNGTDNAFVCRGASGYEVNIFFSAAAMFINADVKETDETFNLATLDFGFDWRKKQVEWRLADGKPFAAIVRVPLYGPRKTSDLYFGEVVGERLVVRGLKGHEKISGEVDAKKANANVRARQIADKGYSQAELPSVR